MLNCASVSCSALPPRALTSATLDSTLDAAARGFLADRSKNRLSPDGWLELSSIFKWNGDDFRAAAKGLPAYVARYWQEPLTAQTPVRFLPYDGSLNGSW